MYLIFDSETTGLPKNYNAPLTNFDNWPRLVQLAWQVHDKTGKLIEVNSLIVKPEGFEIPFNAEKIHGIRPTGDKLYYEMYSRDSSKIKLYVVDIVNYKILKSISVPDINFMVFFEE